MAKARTIHVPGEDAPLTDDVAVEAAEAHEATVAAAVPVDHFAEQLTSTEDEDALPEPTPTGRHTRMQLAHMSAAEVCGLYNQVDNYPDGTPLNADMQPLDAGQQQAYYVGRILTRDGWLIGVAVPILAE